MSLRSMERELACQRQQIIIEPIAEAFCDAWELTTAGEPFDPRVQADPYQPLPEASVRVAQTTLADIDLVRAVAEAGALILATGPIMAYLAQCRRDKCPPPNPGASSSPSSTASAKPASRNQAQPAAASPKSSSSPSSTMTNATSPHPPTGQATFSPADEVQDIRGRAPTGYTPEPTNEPSASPLAINLDLPRSSPGHAPRERQIPSGRAEALLCRGHGGVPRLLWFS